MDFQDIELEIGIFMKSSQIVVSYCQCLVVFFGH